MPAQNAKTDQTQANGDSSRTLADILVSYGALEAQKAKQVKLAEIQTGKSQEDILMSQKLVDETSLTKAKAELYDVPFIDLASVPVSPEALSLLPQEVAMRFKAFPVSVDPVAKQVVIAMTNPLDLTAIEFIEQKTGMLVKPQAAEPSKIETLISTGYTTSLAKEVSEALHEMDTGDKVMMLDVSKTGVIREEKVAEIVSHILGFAMKARASDVHVEPQETSTRVRYRIDGILQEKSTLPTAWGEKIVMRLLKKTGGIPSLSELGLRGRALKILQENILRPHGIILITGPTGSGKTTTLYSLISALNTSKVNILTLEDPIEYKIPGVNQVQINPAAGLTFASGLRSFLRQDPNIILVGEIRDQETADLAIQASLTGHLVFSTLHTNDAAGALPRLLDMHAEPFLLASSMTCIAAQRVLRRIDEKNKEEYIPEPKILDDMRLVLGSLFPESREIKLYRGRPTSENNNSGYMGRIAIFEVLPVSEKISRLILERKPASDVEAVAKDEGMITLKQDGYLKVLEGVTTIEEVLRVGQE